MTLFTMVGASFLTVMLLMSFLWVIHWFLKNISVVDMGWGLGFALIGIIYMWFGEGGWFRKLVINGMVIVWGLRLSWHLFLRFDRSVIDGRYVAMKKTWGEGILGNTYLFFLFQGFLMMLLSIPFLIVSQNSSPTWSFWEVFGVLVWALAIWGETVSDRQLLKFKQDSKNSGKVCQEGFWRFSRHPNYFFEWLIWVGYALFAFGSPFGSVGILAMVLMLYFLLGVTGVPLSEEQAIRSKGEAYKEYQKSTSSFVPWFRKD